jgi:AraC family transcriptional regulator
MGSQAGSPGAANLGAGQFYGRVASRRSPSGLVLSEVRHREGRTLPAHDHQAPGFYLLVAGGYREWIGGRAVDYRPGAAFFHPAAFRHRDAIGAAGCHLFVVELSGELLARVEPLLPAVPRQDSGGLVAALAGSLRDGLLADDPGAELVREGIVCELAGAWSRYGRGDGAPPWLRRADEALRASLDRRWSLAELAAAAGVHPARLARGFRRVYGESVGERLRRLRVEAARAAVARPGSDLAGVAHACGFADQSHMTRAFRAAFGTTPGEFRRQARTRRSLTLC